MFVFFNSINNKPKMISPVNVLRNYMPRELCDIIQSYMTNNVANQAIKEYYSYIQHEQDVYEDFVLHTYVGPNCYCHRLRRNKDCSWCYKFEYTNVYKLDSYVMCIQDNDQYQKIVYSR
jgi:hypothetical protein